MNRDTSLVNRPFSIDRQEPRPWLELGSVLLAPSGGQWTVHEFHPGEKVELTQDRADGVVRMVVDHRAALRMILL